MAVKTFVDSPVPYSITGATSNTPARIASTVTSLVIVLPSSLGVFTRRPLPLRGTAPGAESNRRAKPGLENLNENRPVWPVFGGVAGGREHLHAPRMREPGPGSMRVRVKTRAPPHTCSGRTSDGALHRCRCGTAALGSFGLGGREPPFGDLAEQRVAMQTEDIRRFGLIPLHAVEHALDDAALELIERGDQREDRRRAVSPLPIAEHQVDRQVLKL